MTGEKKGLQNDMRMYIEWPRKDGQTLGRRNCERARLTCKDGVNKTIAKKRIGGRSMPEYISEKDNRNKRQPQTS